MTTKKRMTLAERDAAALAAEPEPTAQPVAEPEPAAEAAKAPARRAPQTRKKKVDVEVEYAGIQDWPHASARVHPRVRAAFTTLVNQRKKETGGGAREVMTDALNTYFLTMPPFDDYTRELHDRADAEAAVAKRRR